MGPHHQLVEMRCQCKHFYYRINEDSGEKANFTILANTLPRSASLD